MTAEQRLASALADRYRIERELGAGGMATVYLAHDVRHDRRVALKVLRPELAAVIGADRFLAEIRTTANLQHPHILPLFDSGTADGFVFYVMPFIEGETVRDRLDREKQLPIADAVRIATEIAAALDYAHRHGVIHRDIKPENILLHDGSALVADFGIALAASKAGDSRMTETGMSLGTPHYMSPEQALGERAITARSDVYALGCVLYEMLLGEPPFTGPTAQSIVARVLSEKPTSLTTRRERIPAAVEDAVLTALEKLPADRFATASEFSAALRATDAAPRRNAAQVQPRPRLDWRLAAAAGLVIGIVATAAMSAALPRSSAAATFGARSQLTFNGRSARPAISPGGDYLAYVDVQCARSDYNPCRASLLVQAQGSDRPVEILQDVPELGAPRFTHDGMSLLVSASLDSARSGLFVVPRLGGVPRRIGPPGLFDTHATADSAILVPRTPAGARPVARIIEIGAGTVRDSIVLPADGPIDAIGWSPDGRLLALVEDYARLTIVRRDGTVADSLRGPFRSTVRWTPDGSGVLLFRALAVKEDDLDFVAVGRDGRIGSSHVQLPATQTLLRGEFDVARRTGQLALASGSATWDLWLFGLEPDAGPARRRTSGTTWYGMPSISADGERLYYIRGDAIGDNLYMLTEPDTEEALTAVTDPGAAAARVSPDGQRLLFGHAAPSGHRLGILDMATRQATYADGEGFATEVPPSFTPHGVLFVTTDYDGVWRLDPGSARRRALEPPDSIRIRGFAANPAGDSVAVIFDTPGRSRLAVSPLDRWEPRWLHDFGAGEFSRHVSWNRAGLLHFWLWPSGEGAPALWRIGAGGGVASRRVVLPTACNTGHIDIAVDVERGACRGEDIRSDIWLVNLARAIR